MLRASPVMTRPSVVPTGHSLSDSGGDGRETRVSLGDLT
jgi:hypothetical protein